MAQDFYSTLGVRRNASQRDIRSAYRRLARKYHPDVNSGDAEAGERFKRINEAYQVLSDEKTRTDYDQFGENWRHAEQARNFGGWLHDWLEARYHWLNAGECGEAHAIALAAEDWLSLRGHLGEAEALAQEIFDQYYLRSRT